MNHSTVKQIHLTKTSGVSLTYIHRVSVECVGAGCNLAGSQPVRFQEIYEQWWEIVNEKRFRTDTSGRSQVFVFRSFGFNQPSNATIATKDEQPVFTGSVASRILTSDLSDNFEERVQGR